MIEVWPPKFAFKLPQNGRGATALKLCASGSNKYSDSPANPHKHIRARKRGLKKFNPLIHTSATTNSGRKAIIAQLLVMPAPTATAARDNQDSRGSIRYSNRQRIT